MSYELLFAHKGKAKCKDCGEVLEGEFTRWLNRATCEVLKSHPKCRCEPCRCEGKHYEGDKDVS